MRTAVFLTNRRQPRKSNTYRDRSAADAEVFLDAFTPVECEAIPGAKGQE
jgi:hypothetical protein